jgi:hypothetical protein
MKTTTIINRLNKLTADWKAQFDNPPEELSLAWSVDANGVLRLDGEGLCPVSIVRPCTCFDVEWLRLETKEGCINIDIEWPYSGPASIGVIERVSCA